MACCEVVSECVVENVTIVRLLSGPAGMDTWLTQYLTWPSLPHVSHLPCNLLSLLNLLNTLLYPPITHNHGLEHHPPSRKGQK